jgi:hypothetical protein
VNPPLHPQVIRIASDPNPPVGLVLFVAFAALLVAAGIVGEYSKLVATGLVLFIVAWAAYRTAALGAAAVTVMGSLFLDGFVWHTGGQLGAVTLPDVRFLLLLAAVAAAAQLVRRSTRRMQRWAGQHHA